jgi:hypothetical protein
MEAALAMITTLKPLWSAWILALTVLPSDARNAVMGIRETLEDARDAHVETHVIYHKTPVRVMPMKRESGSTLATVNVRASNMEAVMATLTTSSPSMPASMLAPSALWWIVFLGHRALWDLQKQRRDVTLAPA